MNGFLQGQFGDGDVQNVCFYAARCWPPAPRRAQEVAISGKDFLSGAGDAKIAELARQAAASGKTLLITAPPYWQDKAAAKRIPRAANASGAHERCVLRERHGARRGCSRPTPRPLEGPRHAAPKAPAPPARPEAKPVEPKARAAAGATCAPGRGSARSSAEARAGRGRRLRRRSKTEHLRQPAPAAVAAPPPLSCAAACAAPPAGTGGKPAADPSAAIKKRFEQEPQRRSAGRRARCRVADLQGRPACSTNGLGARGRAPLRSAHAAVLAQRRD